MLLQAFSIFDAKSGAFSAPFFAFNAAVAQRNVAAGVREGDSLLSRFPEDYQLYHVGSFDDGTGVLQAIPPVAVCNLVSLREVVHAS